MKRWFRPAAYSLIVVLLALAVFADPAPADPASGFVRAEDRDPSPLATTLPAPSTATPSPAANDATAGAPALHPRGEATFAADLFTAPPPPPAPEPLAAPEPVAAPMPELKVLGWYESDAAPQVFVELGEETHALTPGQLAGDVYRFDSIGAGMARFTYLPTGVVREFAVSDPTVSAE
jgi:hypothetical protein